MRGGATNKKLARKRTRWGEEFRRFRAQFMYSQREMAELLHCCKRTVVSIETEQVRNPHHELQRKFHRLKYKFETQRRREDAKRAARLRAVSSSLPERLKSPFIVTVLTIPFFVAIPYFYFFGFANRWILAGLALWLVAGALGKTMKLPIYKAVTRTLTFCLCLSQHRSC